MGVWMLASLRRKQELAQITQSPLDATKILESTLIHVRREHSVYCTYPREDLGSEDGGVHVVGPDKVRFGNLGTESIRGVFQLLGFYGNLSKYGTGKREDGY